LGDVAKSVIESMSGEYPALKEQAARIVRALTREEEQFRATLRRGSEELNATLVSHVKGGVIPGDRAFYLYDTFGFPLELTREVAGRQGFAVDEAGFERLMEEQRARSRAATSFEGGGERLQSYAELSLEPTRFLGYETTRAVATVRAILLDGSESVRHLTPSLAQGRRVEIVLDQTPFYAEGGGQVGDKGELTWPLSARPEAPVGQAPATQGRFVVEDTQAVGDGGLIAHIGRLESGSLRPGDAVAARVDEDLRADTMRNHTATHILHAALRRVVGTHVRQAGSLVAPDRLRFDFSHLEALTPEQIREVEALANRVVRENLHVHAEQQPYEDALAGGALAFFGDKYAETVRVVGVCQVDADECFSRELCGGTHVHSSGEVGAIIITGETSIGAGLRRLEAVTGRAAAERARAQEEALSRLSAALLVPQGEVEARVQAVREENERLRKQLQAVERRLAQSVVDSATARESSGVEKRFGETRYIIERVEAPNVNFLRSIGDGYKRRYKSAVILLGANTAGRASLLAMSTPDVADLCPANEVVAAAAAAGGGSGGGRAEFAQGAAHAVALLDTALAAGERFIEEKLGQQP
jgi:alanyl-tRNA synthetase